MIRRRLAVLLLLLLVPLPNPWSERLISPARGQQVAADPTDKADKKAGLDRQKRERDEEYYELFKLFADTLDQVERNYVKDISRRELMEAAIEGLLSKLDPFSNYISPDEMDRFKTEVESQFGGIGIQISVRGGRLMIVSPLVGTPAYRAGLKAGDHIIRIEGESTAGIKRPSEAVRKLKGKVGTSVTFTVRHALDRREETVTVKRETVRVTTVLGDRRKADDTWNFVYDADKKIGYIRLTSFSRHTPRELRTALARLKQDELRGLVLDLRFNPGGLLSSAIQVSDMFVSGGRIVSTEGRNVQQRVWDAHKRGTFEGFPIAVLVNQFSASASEIVSACLKDHGRAVIVGQRTWGKGSVQNVIEMEGGRSALKLTTAGYKRPNGKNIHRFPGAKDADEWGVMPSEGFQVKLSEAELGRLVDVRHRRDIVGAQTEEDSPPQQSEDRPVDRQLEKALAYLDEQLAAAPPQKKPAQKKPDQEKDKPQSPDDK